MHIQILVFRDITLCIWYIGIHVLDKHTAFMFRTGGGSMLLQNVGITVPGLHNALALNTRVNFSSGKLQT